MYQRDYRGRAQALDTLNVVFLVAGLIGTITACLVLSLESQWAYSLLTVLIFVVVGLSFNKIIRIYTNCYFRQGHFLLALFLRAENNRLYLKHNILLRPGYMAKWIEVHSIDHFTPFERILGYLKSK